ncbi:MAG TPA: AAA family ATPase [Polyangia bacterium]|nr:AAA family ATPase [Polyangia bacterium]
MDASPSVGRRYRLLEPLGRGGMGVVFKALDRLTGQRVALKRIRISPATGSPGRGAEPLSRRVSHFASESTLTPRPRPDAASGTEGGGAKTEPTVPESLRLALAQEFRTLASLRHPHIISVLDYGFDDERQPYFTMELLEGAVRLASGPEGPEGTGGEGIPEPLPARIGLLLQVLQALTYLHRRGVLHRDLKPANILVVQSAAGPQVKLLDFGLALPRRKEGDARGQVLGTVGYIAPEVVRGEPVSEAADLFSLGVVAYELLTRRHPLLPRPSSTLPVGEACLEFDFDGLDLPLPVVAVLRRLLARAPAERYASAEQAAVALASAGRVPLPEESATVRESFLQAADFVGREAEFEALRQALTRASAGRGSAWLVGGESGVGKSRLLDELRTWALVEGACVLRGQATSDGGAGLGLFVDALRTRCLMGPAAGTDPLDPLAAGVLKGLVPDLPQLIEEDVPDPPELDAQAARLRLMSTVEQLLSDTPGLTLLLLEDLQWLAADALELLQRMVPRLGERPLLVVGTYRNDERPDLPRLLPEAYALLLHRLDRAAIVELSASMLGRAGASPGLVEFIERETEGNTYFIVEVVRALAEEAGSLAAVAQGPLPREVFAGGLQSMVQRRLQRIPAGARPLLAVAAVAGRQLDLRVLAEFEPELDAWLQGCAEAAVLEVSEASWRFAHDKLREGLLAELSAETRQGIHRRLAEALERVYGEALEHAAALAYHFDEARVPGRAARYAARAGAWAARRGALGEAVTLLERAVELYEGLGRRGLELAEVLLNLARALRGLGRIEECIAVAARVMVLAEQPLPETPLERHLRLVQGLVRELMERVGVPRRLLAPRGRPGDRILLELLSSVGDAFFVAPGRSEEALLLGLRNLRLAEALGSVPDQVVMLSGLGGILFLAGAHRLGKLYLRRALALAEGVEAPLARATCYRLWGFIRSIEGDWAAAIEDLTRFGRLCHEVGDAHQEAVAWICTGQVLLLTGRWSEAEVDVREGLLLAQRAGAPQYQAIGLGMAGLLEMRRGRLAPAQGLLERAWEHVERSSNEMYRMCVLAFRAQHALWAGEMEAALRLAALAMDPMARMRLATPMILEGYHALLSVWEHGGLASPGEALGPEHTYFEEGLRRLRRLTSIFVIAQPRALLWEGRWQMLRGHRDAARSRFEAGLARARQLGMPYDVGLGHLWLGRALLDLRGPAEQVPRDARAHLAEAVAIFGSLGASRELGQAETLLEFV